MGDFMQMRILPMGLAAALAVVTGYAQSNAPNPVNKTTSTSGKKMYAGYCASCHGVDGKGNGPAASALKVPPTDLTLLSKNNNGRFPGAHIDTVLQFGSGIPSHGSPEMPVWGPILGEMDKANPLLKKLRISNLIRYLESIQVK
jgi:mono/diheme cytochrome c family protein